MNRTTLPHSLGAALTAEQIRVSVPQMLALLADERGPRYVCQRGSKPGFSVTAYCPRAHVIYRTHSPKGLASALKGIALGRMGDYRPPFHHINLHRFTQETPSNLPNTHQKSPLAVWKQAPFASIPEASG